MGKTHNCENCGAPIDMETDKCPYCGTSYFDFSNIEIDAPIVLKPPIILKLKHQGQLFIAKAFCANVAIETFKYDEYSTINLEFVASNIKFLKGEEK